VILGAHVSIAGGVSNAPLNAQKLGINAFQIFTKNQNRWKDKPLEPAEVEKYLANCESCDIRRTVAHSAYLINLCTTDNGKLKMSRNAFLDEMMRAEQLRIPYLVMHPGSHLGAGESEGIRLIAESLRMLFNQQPDGKVRVLLETTAGQGTNLGYRFEQMAELIELIDCDARVGVCLDTCHIFAAGYDIRTPDAYEATIAEFDRVVGLDRLYVFHFNDSRRELGSRIDRHEHLGNGKIGVEPFKLFVQDPRFTDLPGLIETPGDMEDFAGNLDILRGLEGEK